MKETKKETIEHNNSECSMESYWKQLVLGTRATIMQNMSENLNASISFF